MAIIYWTGDALTDNFGTAGNWSTGTVPASFDQARINDGAGVADSGYVVVLSLTTNAGASLGINAGQSFTMLEGTGIGANAGEINIFDGAELLAGGTIDNTGHILLASTGDPTQLIINPFLVQNALTLSGGGQVVMTGDAEVDITTNINNTISGAGTVSLANNEKKGVINANSHLTVNASDQTLTNGGTLEATGSGQLTLKGTINGSSGGLIDAAAASAIVDLDGVTLIGGTLETSGGGAILTTAASTFDGITAPVNNEGVLSLGATLALEGTINNTGSIDLMAAGIAINAAGATLEGRGAISFTGDSVNGWDIVSDAPSARLTNVNNIISGYGLIGNSGSNTMKLVNETTGVIDGNRNDFVPLIIDTGTNAVANSGTLEASGGGELYIASPVTNTGNLSASFGSDLVAAGVVTGGRATIAGTGTIEFGAAASALTTFATSSTGRLILDDAAQYTGTVSGFGKNTAQSMDLPNVQFATASKTYSGVTLSGGTLTVKDTSGDVAKIKFSGSYTLASFTLSNDGNGGTLITDPPVAKTTHTTGVDIALFGNYIASSLVGGSLGQGGGLSTDASALLSPPLLATPGHA
jgi:hypothetical protein